MGSLLLKYFSVYLIATIKFFGGILLGISTKLSIWETALFTFLGAMTAIVLVSSFATRFRPFISRQITRVKCWFYTFLLFVLKPLLSEKRIHALKRKLSLRRKPKKFSKTIRIIVRAWKRFGITGVAFLTPLLLSPIGGALIAVSFRVPLKKIIIHMAIFHAIFSLLFAYVITEFGQLIEDLLGITLSK